MCFFYFLILSIFIFCKAFIEFATILLLFYVLVFGRKACGILAPPPGIKPASPALEGEVLTTGLPGKSCLCFEVPVSNCGIEVMDPTGCFYISFHWKENAVNFMSATPVIICMPIPVVWKSKGVY